MKFIVWLGHFFGTKGVKKKFCGGGRVLVPCTVKYQNGIHVQGTKFQTSDFQL